MYFLCSQDVFSLLSRCFFSALKLIIHHWSREILSKRLKPQKRSRRIHVSFWSSITGGWALDKLDEFHHQDWRCSQVLGGNHGGVKMVMMHWWESGRKGLKPPLVVMSRRRSTGGGTRGASLAETVDRAPPNLTWEQHSCDSSKCFLQRLRSYTDHIYWSILYCLNTSSDISPSNHML